MMLNKLLSPNPVLRLRRHHALEHATLQVLAQKRPVPLAGYSDLRGFWIVGNLSPEEVQQAAEEALSRLKAGEARLAVHPNCGTNYVTAGVLAGGAAWLGMRGSGNTFRRQLDRLPLVITLVTLMLIIAQPVGLMLQSRVTTYPNPGGLQIFSIMEYSNGSTRLYRVLTRG